MERIVSFLDPKDCIALRLTCKKLENAATSSFAKHFIRCRRHVLSTYSLKTLVDIAAHPNFGQFIEAIILDTTCSPAYIKSLTSGTTDGPLNYADFYHALKEVFGYMSLHGNLNTLGLTDRNPISFGIQELVSQPTAPFFEQQRGHVLYNLRRSAKDVNLNISQLDIDSVQALKSGVDLRNFASMNIGLAQGLPPSTSLKFKVSMTNMNEFGLIWNHESKSLKMTGLIEWVQPVPDNMVFGLLRDMTLISSASIKELVLSSCHVRTDHDYSKLIEFLHTCSRTLEKVKLSGIVI